MLFRAMLMIFALTGFAATGMAADGSSGCGPAWYIFKQNTMVSSLLRGTTNGILSPVVTFGMTSGTSNCAKHTLVDKKQQKLHFVTVNYDNLRHDAARGGGEFLRGYFKAFDCNVMIEPHFNKVMQANFEDIFVAPEAPGAITEMSDLVIKADPILNGHCAAA